MPEVRTVPCAWVIMSKPSLEVIDKFFDVWSLEISFSNFTTSCKLHSTTGSRVFGWGPLPYCQANQRCQQGLSAASHPLEGWNKTRWPWATWQWVRPLPSLVGDAQTKRDIGCKTIGTEGIYGKHEACLETGSWILDLIARSENGGLQNSPNAWLIPETFWHDTMDFHR